MLPLIAHFALAVLADAAALTVWDIGTRPVGRLVRDLAAGTRSPASLARGILRFVAGAALLTIGAAWTAPAAPDRTTFTVLESGLLVAALVIETLVGAELRRRTEPPPR